MVLIGLLITRPNTSLELLWTNLAYGPIGYLFIAISGLFIIKILQVVQNQSDSDRLNSKHLILLISILFLIGLSLTSINVILNSLNASVIAFVVFIELLWILLGFLAYKKRINSDLTLASIATTVFTLGLIYGALFNIITLTSSDALILLTVVFILITISFLQFSRELVKSYDRKNRGGGFITILSKEKGEKVTKISLLFQVISFIFFILPLFSGITYVMLYLILMFIGLIIIGTSVVLTYNDLKVKNKINEKIPWLLKIAILIEMITFFAISS